MNVARPTVSEERGLAIADRYPALREAVDRLGLAGRWKAATWLARCVGFVLGLVGAGMLAGVLRLFPAPLFIGGLLLLVAAEWLIARRHVVRSGFEEAMYLCGATAVAVQLLIWIDTDNASLAVALVAMAVLLAGWRLLNPLFTTLATADLTLSIGLFRTTLFDGRLNTLAAALACALLAAGALVAGGRSWQRPSHDRMLDGLVIAMPWLAYGWVIAYPGNIAQKWLPLALSLAFVVATTAVGASRRAHPPLVSALGSAACALHAVYMLLGWPVHWRLIVIGALALAAAVLLERLLRDRRNGITSRPIDEPAGLDLAHLAAAAHLPSAPGVPSGPAPAPAVQGQGGDFGGGGASGRF